MLGNFFAPYAVIGLILFSIYIAISLILGIILGKIIKKKYTSILVIIMMAIIFYFFDLIYSALSLGVLALMAEVFYLLKKQENENK